MKCILIFFMLLFLSGCVVHGSSVNPLNAFEIQGQKAVDHVIYQQAQDALNHLHGTSYSVKVELTSGPVMTLLVSESQEVTQFMVHGQGYTQWVQLFDDRILCLTGDNGHVEAQILDDLSSYGDMETIIRCVVDPVSLVEGRHFQRTSGAEEGSVQIATDNIDFWMKVNEQKIISQVKLYFSDFPMMTLYYSEEIPLFPTINKSDYPLYSDLMEISEEILVEHDFAWNEDKYVRQKDDSTEIMMLNGTRLDYTMNDDQRTIHLVYDGLILKGVYTSVNKPDYCEVDFTQNLTEENELNCTSDEMKEMNDLFESLIKEFETHNFTH